MNYAVSYGDKSRGKYLIKNGSSFVGLITQKIDEYKNITVVGHVPDNNILWVRYMLEIKISSMMSFQLKSIFTNIESVVHIDKNKFHVVAGRDAVACEILELDRDRVVLFMN